MVMLHWWGDFVGSEGLNKGVLLEYGERCSSVFGEGWDNMRVSYKKQRDAVLASLWYKKSEFSAFDLRLSTFDYRYSAFNLRLC